MDSKTTQQRVTEKYFSTKSAGAVASSGGIDESVVAGLRRRLGGWLDVAGKDVVDLSSGLGEDCRVCREAGATSATGLNLSEDEISLAQQHVDAKFVCQDLEAFLRTSSAETVDRFLALNVLGHVGKETLAHMLDRAHRVLRPGGTLIAMVPNGTHRSERWPATGRFNT